MLKIGKYKYKSLALLKRTYAVLQQMWQSIFSRSTEVLVPLERTSSGILCTELIQSPVLKEDELKSELMLRQPTWIFKAIVSVTQR